MNRGLGYHRVSGTRDIVIQGVRAVRVWQRAQPRCAILRTRPAEEHAVAHPTCAYDAVERDARNDGGEVSSSRCRNATAPYNEMIGAGFVTDGHPNLRYTAQSVCTQRVSALFNPWPARGRRCGFAAFQWSRQRCWCCWNWPVGARLRQRRTRIPRTRDVRRGRDEHRRIVSVRLPLSRHQPVAARPFGLGEHRDRARRLLCRRLALHRAAAGRSGRRAHRLSRHPPHASSASTSICGRRATTIPPRHRRPAAAPPITGRRTSRAPISSTASS